MTKERDSAMGEEEVSQEEEVVLSDKEHLENLFERQRELKSKSRQAEAKRKQSRDVKERLRLKRSAEAWGEESEALGVEVLEVSARIQEGEREKVIEEAEALREAAQKNLEVGVGKIKWCLGYLKVMWKSHKEVWALRQQFRMSRDAYHDLCRKHGIEARDIKYQQYEDLTRFSGKGIPNADDMLHRQNNFLAWISDMVEYGRGRIDAIAPLPAKDRWEE